jgi:hypothetical protein
VTTRAQQARWEQFKNPQPGVVADSRPATRQPVEPHAADTLATWAFWSVSFVLLLVGFLSSTRAGQVNASSSKQRVRWIRAARQAFGLITPTKIALTVGSGLCAVVLPYLAWSTAARGTWEIKTLARVTPMAAVETHSPTGQFQTIRRLRHLVRQSPAIQIHR